MVKKSYLHATIHQTIWIRILPPMQSQKVDHIKLKETVIRSIYYVAKWNQVNEILRHV